MARLGRPKELRTQMVSIKFKPSEYSDFRKVCIADDVTMSDFVRGAIRRRKRVLKERGKWPESDDR